MADLDWTGGYVADLGYQHGFYREMTPAFLSFVALAAGQAPFDAEAPFTYCDLGCGQGFSVNLLAAANPLGQFFATDFNPSHIAGARALAAEAGTQNIRFFDTPFARFADEPDLPESFDIISLHGIYSWVNAENRAAIVDFLARKLKIGGLVYISYNALPGWSGAMPLRRLFIDRASGQNGPTASRIEDALDFAERIRGAGANFFADSPALTERFDRIRKQNRNYLAHEYLNREWTPFYHADVAADLARAKLTFLGSAALIEDIDVINLTTEQQAILAEVRDPSQRETVRGYFFNQQFRRDVFIRGPLLLSQRRLSERWLEQRFALTKGRGNTPLQVPCRLGEVKLPEPAYGPILESLAAGAKSMREIVAAHGTGGLTRASFIQGIMILVGSGTLQPCTSPKAEEGRVPTTHRFNAAVAARARDSGELSFLASPVTGGGIAVERVIQLFLLALAEGGQTPADWAAFAWKTLQAQNLEVYKDGQPLATPEDSLIELEERATDFGAHLSILQNLRII